MQMHVPEHIYVGGSKRRSKSQTNTHSDVLTVPERITLGGKGTHFGAKANFGKDLIRGQIDAITVKVNILYVKN